MYKAQSTSTVITKRSYRRVKGQRPLCAMQEYCFSFSSRLHPSQKRPIRAPPRLPKVALETVLIFCPVEHRLFPTSESGMSIASFLHSSFLQAINAVMLWPVHVWKVSQASEHLCLAKLQTRCAIYCACQSICPFIPTDSGMPRAVDP